MRTLKRTLCLVLAMTMVFGFFGVASAKNASEYPDYDDTQYKEAVDVMVGIDVIDGMGGEINPTGKVTRAQAAKMVTYAILGKDNAEKLPASKSSFADVNSYYNWAIPSIEYLVDKGIVSGRSGLGGNYDPEGEVTAHELAKMLLCAVGYGVNNEYTGNGWELPVAVDATRLGVFDGCKETDRNSAATREECAKYIFNSIVHINQVVWDKGKGLYVKSQDENDKDFGTIAGEIYGLRYNNGPTNTGVLAYDANTTDAYGRPATQWDYKGKTISFIVDAPVLTYSSNYVPAEAYKTLKDDGYKFDDNFATAINGVDGEVEPSKAFGKNTDEISGNGIVTEFFANSKNVITKMVTIQTVFLGVADIDKDNAKTAIDERTITFTNTNGTKTFKATPDAKNFDAVYKTVKALKDADKEAGALVVIKPDDKSVISVSLPTFEELKITSVKNTTGDNSVPVSFVADGDTYYYAEKNLKFFKDMLTLEVGNTYTVYFDAYGYAVYADVVEENLDAGVVLATDASFDNSEFQVKLLTVDGNVEKLTVKYGPDEKDPYKYSKGDIVTYKEGKGSDEGIYTLESKASQIDFNTDSDKIVTGDVNMTLANAGDAKTQADAKTIFLVQSKDSNENPVYNVYTGIKNVPTINKADNVTIYTKDEENDKFADVVFVAGAEPKGEVIDGVIFVAVDSSKKQQDENYEFYDAAFISGSGMTDITAKKVTEDAAATLAIAKVSNKAPFIKSYTEEDGYVTAVELFEDADSVTTNPRAGEGIGKATSETIRVGTDDYHTYTDECTVWVIDPSKKGLTEKFAPKKISSVTADDNDDVYWIENVTNHQISALYIVKVADHEEDPVVPAPTGKVWATSDDDTAYTVNYYNTDTPTEEQAVAAVQNKLNDEGYNVEKVTYADTTYTFEVTKMVAGHKVVMPSKTFDTTKVIKVYKVALPTAIAAADDHLAYTFTADKEYAAEGATVTITIKGTGTVAGTADTNMDTVTFAGATVTGSPMEFNAETVDPTNDVTVTVAKADITLTATAAHA